VANLHFGVWFRFFSFLFVFLFSLLYFMSSDHFLPSSYTCLKASPSSSFSIIFLHCILPKVWTPHSCSEKLWRVVFLFPLFVTCGARCRMMFIGLFCHYLIRSGSYFPLSLIVILVSLEARRALSGSFLHDHHIFII